MGFWLAIDVIGAALLLVAGVFSLLVWRGDGPGRRGSLYWLLAGIGLVYLSGDERLSVHEHLGKRLYEAGVPTPPGFNHLDDAILASFALAGAIVTVAFGRELLRHRQVIPPMFAGGVLTAASLAVDGFAPVEGFAPKIEELLEFAGILCLFAALSLRFLEERDVRLPGFAWRPGLEEGDA